jgi:aminopeptidase N
MASNHFLGLNQWFQLTDDNDHKSFELPGARPHYSPDRPGQVEHIALDLILDLSRQHCQGHCQIRLKLIREGITNLTLDAVNQTIYGVEINGVPQKFEYDGEQLQIFLTEQTHADQVLTLEIDYSLDRPQRGLYFIQPDAYYPDKPTQVWTQGEDEDSRYWFPCFDYPGQLATSEIRVEVPQDFLAISNGELVAVQETPSTKIYHWVQEQVHPTYLMTLAVGQFAEIQDQWQGKPVTYYVERGREADAQRTMGKTPRMIEFFSKTFGYPYPYPKYAQVCTSDFIFGGMENTSTTLLTDRCLLDERAALDNRAAETLVAHELAHQWFGDLVVIKHWSHAWIKEGMATYSETLWITEEYGKDEGSYYQLCTARSYLEEDRSRYRRPIVTHVYREPIELYDRHLYEKGACLYHMIRQELGEDLFWQAIQTFVQTHAHQTVETVDLLRSIEQATGRNLLFLFDQYGFRGGHPAYKVAYSWDKDSNLAKVTVTQTQAKSENQGKDLFDLKIAIGFGNRDGELQNFTVRVHAPEQSFYFPLSEKPEFISFDRDNPTLKTLTLEYPLPELKAQLQHDPDPVSRIYAAEAIAKKGGREAVKALEKALTTDSFWGVRAEVASQLAKVKLNQAFEALLSGLNDPDPRVRRAVVAAIAHFKTPQSYEILSNLAEQGDASYLVEASAIGALGSFMELPQEGQSQIGKDHSQILTLLTSILQNRSGWNETVRSAAIRALSHMKTSEAALDLILQYTALGTSQPLRLAAIRALGTISTGQSAPHVDRILTRLRELTRETFFLTQMAVIGALKQMETPQAISLLQALGDQITDGRVRRSIDEASAAVQSKLGSDRAVKKLQKELDQLKKDNQDLRSRLEALEAKAQS